MSKQEIYAAQAAYDSALAAYEAFRAAHVDLIEEHDALALNLSETLESLKRTLQANPNLIGRQFGPFKVSIPRKFDYEALQAALGDAAENYAKIKYSVDSKKFDEDVKSGVIPQQVVDAVVSDDTPRILGGPTAPAIYQR